MPGNSPLELPQFILDELAAWMDANGVQSLTLNKLYGRAEVKLEVRLFSTQKVTAAIALR
jgi:hypothetical protein